MSRAPHPPEPVLAQATQGYRTTLVSQAVRLACKAASVVLMARLVAPVEHGRFAMASSVFALLALFRDVGLGTAAVQARELDEPQLNTLFWAHVVLGLTLAALTALAAPGAAWFFHSPVVAPLLATMSVAFLLIGAGGFMRAQLYRSLAIPTANRLETIAAVAGTVAMLGAGWAGANAYAFVVFLLVSEGVATALAWMAQSWRPSQGPTWRSLRGLWRTGRDLTVHQALTFLLQQLDTVAVGRGFGAYSVGLYSRVGQMLTLPSVYVAAPLGSVLLATLARLAPDSKAFRQHAMGTVSAVAHLVLPPFAVCIVLPAETVRLVLGPQWPAAAPLLRALAIGGAALALIALAQSINIALRRTDRLVGAAALAVPFTVVGIVLGARHGTIGIAWGVALSHVALLGPRVAWLLRDWPRGWIDFGAALLGPVVAMAVLMGGLAAAAALADSWGGRLGAGALGAVLALALAGALWPRLRREWRATLHYLPRRAGFAPAAADSG